jgi:hypothetical protein
MFRSTSTQSCPWVVVDGNRKDEARMEAMRYVLSLMDYPGKGSAVECLKPKPELIRVLSSAAEADAYLSANLGH